ncbi:2Fe-2S iron-sulfur cluster-binding protein [Chloroflexota bacterium]
MVTLTIDGQEIQAKEGATILEAAREKGIEIPTLCYHDSVSSAGACRLCMVELTKNNQTRLAASCLYPVEEGLMVKTDSPKVMNVRKTAMELLLARCPNSEPIQDMARAMGVDTTDLDLEDEDCILCGLCVRVCQEIAGVSTISLASRGTKRKVAPPFEEASEDCIGCGSCAHVCPTGCIKIEDIGDTRTIHNWKVEFKMRQCRECGKYFAPEAQLDYLSETLDLPKENFELCQDCRVKAAQDV